MFETVMWNFSRARVFLRDTWWPIVGIIILHTTIAVVAAMATSKFILLARDVHTIAEDIRSSENAVQANTSQK